jgi:hypothetical protein
MELHKKCKNQLRRLRTNYTMLFIRAIGRQFRCGGNWSVRSLLCDRIIRSVRVQTIGEHTTVSWPGLAEPVEYMIGLDIARRFLHFDFSVSIHSIINFTATRLIPTQLRQLGPDKPSIYNLLSSLWSTPFHLPPGTSESWMIDCQIQLLHLGLTGYESTTPIWYVYG